MVLDISLEAIEADFRMAERGGQVADLAMARAQVRATLLAAQPADHQGRHEAPETPSFERLDGTPSPVANGLDINVRRGPDADVYVVPPAATWDDRVTAAAMLLKVPEVDLVAALEHLGELPPGVLPVEAPTEEDARAGEPEEDIDADFFAEAKRARKGSKK